jgi:hypothetical protein
MRTDPTPQVTAAAGTPLSHTAIESGRHFSQRTLVHAKPAETISDTLETSDRDADGRYPHSPEPAEPVGPSETNPPQATGDNLDLTV